MMKIKFLLLVIALSINLYAKKKNDNKNGYKIQVHEDAFIQAGSSSSENFGDEGDLRLQNPGKENQYYREIVLKYKLKNIPEVENATIYIFGKAFIKEGREGNVVNVSVERINNDWKEYKVNWNNVPAKGKELAQITVEQTAKPCWYKIKLDPQVVNEAKKNGYLSVRLRHTSNTGIGASFFAKEKTWTNGVMANHEPYLLINDTSLEDEQANVISDGEMKLVATSDAMVKSGVNADKVFDKDLVINGNKNNDHNSELYLHFETSQIKDQIDEAILFMPVLSVDEDVKLSFYDGCGADVIENKITWNNKPRSASNIGELTIKKKNQHLNTTV